MSAMGMTSTEIAAAAEMPVREVNQLIDDRVVPARFVRTEGGRRLIAEDGLVFVFLETIASEKLAPAERRKVGEAMIENKKLRTFADGIVRIDVLRVRREITKRLDRLKRARAMVSSDPSVMGGLPCFRGTRIPVHDIAGMIRAGDSVDVVLRHYLAGRPAIRCRFSPGLSGGAARSAPGRVQKRR
jgi:Protein of unknown function (DUF433)